MLEEKLAGAQAGAQRAARELTAAQQHSDQKATELGEAAAAESVQLAALQAAVDAAHAQVRRAAQPSVRPIGFTYDQAA